MNQTRRLILFVILMSLLFSIGIIACTKPKNKADCLMKYQGKSQCTHASRLISLACECKFNRENKNCSPFITGDIFYQISPDKPLSAYSDAELEKIAQSKPIINDKVINCLLENIDKAQNDFAAGSILQSCKLKYITDEEEINRLNRQLK